MTAVPIHFRAILDPGPEEISRIAALDPSNPFHTSEYAAVRRDLGARLIAFFEEGSDQALSGCLGTVTHGRLNSRLEITSLPVIADPAVFWPGLFDESRRLGMSGLNLNSFASKQVIIPDSAERAWHKRRCEFVLDLRIPDLFAIMNRRHRRQIKAARSAGLKLIRADGEHARETHVRMANANLDRLRGRGESIDAQITRTEVDAFLDHRAGWLFQAIGETETFSSLLVAVSQSGAYGQSSGTSFDGRDIGASHFLFHETACYLKSEGIELFNLGGADEHNAGLHEFKSGMGSARVDLESAEFFLGGRLKKFATGLVSLLRN